uniref:Putative secreted protein n=1 Tax=Anopheles darlingi TaxID=43151 RepID=A0A2M4DL63_ANODA
MIPYVFVCLCVCMYVCRRSSAYPAATAPSSRPANINVSCPVCSPSPSLAYFVHQFTHNPSNPFEGMMIYFRRSRHTKHHHERPNGASQIKRSSFEANRAQDREIETEWKKYFSGT